MVSSTLLPAPRNNDAAPDIACIPKTSFSTNAFFDSDNPSNFLFSCSNIVITSFPSVSIPSLCFIVVFVFIVFFVPPFSTFSVLSFKSIVGLSNSKTTRRNDVPAIDPLIASPPT